MDVPQAKVVVLDGTALATGQRGSGRPDRTASDVSALVWASMSYSPLEVSYRLLVRRRVVEIHLLVAVWQVRMRRVHVEDLVAGKSHEVTLSVS